MVTRPAAAQITHKGLSLKYRARMLCNARPRMRSTCLDLGIKKPAIERCGLCLEAALPRLLPAGAGLCLYVATGYAAALGAII